MFKDGFSLDAQSLGFIVVWVLLFHGRTCTAYLYRCVWGGITGR